MKYALVYGLYANLKIPDYLPDNYKVFWSARGAAIIKGEDKGGFTLTGYLFPRIQDGNMSVRELDQSEIAENIILYS